MSGFGFDALTVNGIPVADVALAVDRGFAGNFPDAGDVDLTGGVPVGRER